MTTLASLVVDLQVQNAQLKKGLEESTRKLDEFGKGAKAIGAALNNVFSFAVAKAGLDRFGGFVREGVAALADQEKSAGRLSAAFAALGYDAQKVAPYFNDLAEQLEDETLIAGETVRQVEQLLVQFGVAPRQIEQTTRALLDYSAATGKDAVGAAQQLGTAVASGKDEIQKMGVSIQATGDFTKDLVQVTEQLAGHFGGSAKGATENLAGQLGRLQKAQEDLGKAFAHFFVESDTGKAVIKALTEAMDGMAYALSKEASQEAAATHRTEQLTKLRDQLTAAEKRLTLERGRQGTWMASAGALDEAKRERDAILAKINLLEAAKIEAGHAIEAEAERARQAEEAAKAEASAEAKRIQNAERLKKATEAAAAAAKKAAEEREALFKRLTAEAERWAEAQAKAAAQFERTKAEVGRGLDERRRAMGEAGGAGAPDTRGFSGFEAALAELQAKLLEEAALRERAAMAEVDGNTELQGSLELLADQQAAAAENAGKAADAFVDLEKASGEARRAMEEAAKAALDAMVSKAIGPVGGLIQAGQQGAAAGAVFGPQGAAIGAVAGVGLELLSQSAQFKELMDVVGQTIQSVADALGSVLEPLIPFARLTAMFAEALGSILVPIFQALEPVFRVLYEIVRGFMLLVLNVEEAIVSVINAVAGFFGLGKLDDSGIKSGIDKLNRATFDTATSTEKLGKAAESATEEILNAPAGFKGLALARWSAVDMDAGPPGAGGGGGAGAEGGPGSGGGWTAPGPGGGSGGGGIGRGPGGGRSMNLTGGGAPVVEVHVNADLERYVKVQSRNRSYATAGSSQPLSLAFDY